MYLIHDTETTGFPNNNLLVTDPAQAQICQLGARLLTPEKRVVAELNVLIKPDGWTIPDHVQKIHGISTEMCIAYGIPLSLALTLFNAMCSKAQVGVAHNLPFDSTMLCMAYEKENDNLSLVENSYRKLKTFCTMRATTNICQLPGRNGAYKWPKLIEAYQYLFNEGFEGAHDAMADVRACERVFFHEQVQANFIRI